MKYQIISDSSADVTEEMKEKWGLKLIPFTITVDGVEFVDDDHLDPMDLLEAMRQSSNPIRSGCPSPYDYQKAMEECGDCEGIFILTISSKLSGSYNSAYLAKQVFEEENPGKKIYVLDSKTAGPGQTNILLALYDFIKEGMDFETIIEKAEEHIKNLNTFFILESLDNLMKNGRISKSKGLIANAFNIKPIMRGIDGEIGLYELNRGFKRSLSKLAGRLGEIEKDLSNRILTISHVDALDKAMFFKEKVLEKYTPKDIIIVPTLGLATAYADDGGIIITF
ncbi:MAG: DegV family protein [Tissierellia bacterium]|nr:DegV family protein [Tissierellia bacterium]